MQRQRPIWQTFGENELPRSNRLARMWKSMARKLGVVDDEHLSVLADGQRWIWDQASLCWKKAQWVLDVFHVSEHIHGCGKILFGESGPQHQAWAEDQTLQLIEQGPVEYVKNLKDLLAIQTAPQQIKAIDSLLGYLESNLDSLWYRARLAAGRPIGTGLIEGGCKTIVSNRLPLQTFLKVKADLETLVSAVR
jgi:hypothetical protein